MKLTINQALALIRAELVKADGPIKNTAVRQASQLAINVNRLGIGETVVMTVKDPPKPRSGKSSKKPSATRADARSANSTTGRRG